MPKVSTTSTTKTLSTTLDEIDSLDSVIYSDAPNEKISRSEAIGCIDFVMYFYLTFFGF